MRKEDRFTILQGVNEWLRFSDSKAGVIIAFQGVTAGFLISNAKILSEVGKLGGSCTRFICLFLLVIGAASSLISLLYSFKVVYPRLNIGEPKSRIFFAHIASLKTATDYSKEISNKDYDLETDISNQIWANSKVAWRKYKAIHYSMLTAAIGYVTLGLGSLIVWRIL